MPGVSAVGTKATVAIVFFCTPCDGLVEILCPNALLIADHPRKINLKLFYCLERFLFDLEMQFPYVTRQRINALAKAANALHIEEWYILAPHLSLSFAYR